MYGLISKLPERDRMAADVLDGVSNEQRYYRDICWVDMASSDHQGYGIKCEPDERREKRPFAEYFQTHSFPSASSHQQEAEKTELQSVPSPYSHNELLLEPTLGQLTQQPQAVQEAQQLDLPVSDMDLNNLLDMDDKTLTGEFYDDSVLKSLC